jgi:hypothetical protein
MIPLFNNHKFESNSAQVHYVRGFQPPTFCFVGQHATKCAVLPPCMVNIFDKNNLSKINKTFHTFDNHGTDCTAPKKWQEIV